MRAASLAAAIAAIAVRLVAPLPAAAQDLATRIEADLDGDGAPEVFVLSAPDEDRDVDLAVETASGGFTVADAAWSGPMAGQEAFLELSEAGSVVLVSGNEAIGRGRWRLDVTIAHRDGDLRIAGLTYMWRDTLDPEAGGSCDLNLLTGRGVVRDGGTRSVAILAAAPLLRDWRRDDALAAAPPDCG